MLSQALRFAASSTQTEKVMINLGEGTLTLYGGVRVVNELVACLEVGLLALNS